MNTTSKQMTLSSHKVCITLLLLCGLTALFSSCEKDAIGAGTGRKIAVTLAVNSGGYTADAPRSYDAREMEPETTVVPLGNDLYMYATLESSPDELRASLNNGQKLCVAAYTAAGTTPYSAVKYTYTGGALVADPADAQLIVEEGSPYYFVAYSYNSTTEYPSADPANAISLAGIEPVKDLLWGTTPTKPQTITATNKTVGINMEHQFAQVTVVITTGNLDPAARITAIGTVKVSGGKSSTFALQDGTFTATADLDQVVGGLTVPGGGVTSITGSMRLVCPVASPAEVIISNIGVDVDGTAGPEPPKLLTGPFSAKFAKALLAGQNYTLTVDLKETIFAGSNIYWDGSKLTFAAAGTTDKQNYQGVYFKWGSLVGISPALTSGSVSLSTATPLYIPDVSTHAAWIKGNVTTYNLGGSGSANTYGEIPYVAPPMIDDRTTNYLYGVSNAESYNAYKGDICRYLTEKGYAPAGSWRIPVMNEFGYNTATVYWDSSDPENNPVFGGWTRVGGGGTWSDLNAVVNESGTYPITTGARYQGNIFPTSGYRFPPYGTMTEAGIGGGHQSGSSSSNSNRNYCIYSNSTRIYGSNTSFSDYALSVRCVKNN